MKKEARLEEASHEIAVFAIEVDEAVDAGADYNADKVLREGTHMILRTWQLAEGDWQSYCRG